MRFVRTFAARAASGTASFFAAIRAKIVLAVISAHKFVRFVWAVRARAAAWAGRFLAAICANVLSHRRILLSVKMPKFYA